MASMDVERLEALAARLEAIPAVARLALDGEPGGWRVAYNLMETEEAGLKIVRHLIPALEAATTREAAEDALHDLREEVRHLLYHVVDCGLFEDMLPTEQSA
ncbi:MAG: hypothetical protein AB7S41_01500 [Parvibaculaceae bacterium]